jgi:hypothetical protein
MKKVLTLIAVAILATSCGNTKYVNCDAYKTHYKPVKAEKHKHHVKCDAYSSNGIIIKPTGDNEGRPYYSVYMPDGTVHEYMYAEEIARGLTENNWSPDEDLILAYANQE